MQKRGIIRYANYTVCASVFIHFCMQRKNNENIPIMDAIFQPIKKNDTYQIKLLKFILTVY